MPIKAASVTPEKVELSGCDPSGDTWVMIKPITTREDLLRGELLKITEINWTGGIPVQHILVNQYALMLEELYLTFGGGNIVMEYPAEDGEPERRVILFEEGTDIPRRRFMEDVQKLPPEARDEWVQKMRGINQAWLFPF